MKSQNATTEPPTHAPQLTVRIAGTGRGAGLARRIAGRQLAEWGIPYDSTVSRAVVAVTAELAANAVTHGRVPGRDFRLTLRIRPGAVRVEVTDPRPDRMPPAATELPHSDAESGRGLLLVAAYAADWGCESRTAYTKTTWADVTRLGPTRGGHDL